MSELTRPIRTFRRLRDSDRFVVAPVRVVASQRKTKSAVQITEPTYYPEAEVVSPLREVIYRANGLLVAGLERLASSRAPASDAGLLRLAEDLRPGATARAHLAGLDPELQVAGAAEWIARRRRVEPGGELLPTLRLAAGDDRPAQPRVAHPSSVASAATRARSRWHGQVGPR